MAKHIWTVLCKRAIIDTTEHNTSLFDVIEDVQVEADQSLPATWVSAPLQSTLVTLVERTDPAIEERCKLRITVHAPDGGAFENAVTVQLDLMAHSKARHFMRLQKLPIRGAGRHCFLIELEDQSGNWRQAAEVPFIVAATVIVPEQVVNATEQTTETHRQRPKRKAKVS